MRNIKLFFAVAAVIAATAGVTYARDDGITVKYNMADQTVRIESKTAETRGMPVNILVTAQTTDLKAAEQTGETDENIFFKTARYDNNGELECDVALSEKLAPKPYKIIIYDGDRRLESVFFYADAKTVSDTVNTMNGKTKSEIAVILRDKAKVLGLGCNDFYEVVEETAEKVYGSASSGGVTGEKLYAAAAGNMFFHSVETGELSVSEALKKYYIYLGVDSDNKYDNYTAELKENIKALLLSADRSAKDFGDIYEDCLLVAQINGAETEIGIKEIIFSQMSGLDTRYYDQIKNSYYESLVFKEMLAMNDFSSRDDVAKAFLRASENQLNAVNRYKADNGSGKSGGGGGSSGGGGGGTGNVFYREEKTGTSATEENKIVSRFTDIGLHWAQPYIEALAGKQIINGYEDNTFRPENTVTRAEFAKMINELFGFEPVQYSDMFRDVGADDWFCGYVLSMAQKNIVLGENGNFLPQEQITRQDAAVIIDRALGYAGATPEETLDFADADSISDYAYDAVRRLGGAGIIKGYENIFDPQENMTRAQAATVMYNIMTKFF